MANVHIVTIDPDPSTTDFVANLRSQVGQLSKACTRHTVVPDARDADIILLDASFTLFFSHIDPARRSIRNHPLRTRRPEVCFSYDNDDHPDPMVAGASPSLDTRSWSALNQSPSPYLHQLGNDLLKPRPVQKELEHLFSFVGAPSTHPVRQRIRRIKDDRALVIATDARWPNDPAAREAFKRQYADSIHDSKFVLCPRGRGTASVRLFEVLEAGRVPVIISDHWVAPIGPDWNAFSIRVAEVDIERIPDILREREAEAESMAAAARKTFQDWFAQDVVLDKLFDALLDLKSRRHKRPVSRALDRFRSFSQPPTVFRYVLAPVARRLSKSLIRKPVNAKLDK